MSGDERLNKVEIDGVRHAFAKSAKGLFFDARKPSLDRAYGAVSHPLRAEALAPNRLRLHLAWETMRAIPDYQPFVHICGEDNDREGIVFQCGMARAKEMFEKTGKYETWIDVVVPADLAAGTYRVREEHQGPAPMCAEKTLALPVLLT